MRTKLDSALVLSSGLENLERKLLRTFLCRTKFHFSDLFAGEQPFGISEFSAYQNLSMSRTHTQAATVDLCDYTKYIVSVDSLKECHDDGVDGQYLP